MTVLGGYCPDFAQFRTQIINCALWIILRLGKLWSGVSEECIFVNLVGEGKRLYDGGRFLRKKHNINLLNWQK